MILHKLLLSSCMVALMAGAAGCAPMEGVYTPDSKLAKTLPANSLARSRAEGGYVPSTPESFKAAPVIRDFKGQALDLTDFKVTFNDDFDHMSVTDERGDGPWYSPVHSQFGGAVFLPPRPGKGPVYTRDGNLVIQLEREGRDWIGTNVQSVNKDGKGFAQQYGYFEMRAKLAEGLGSWGGFWLHSHDALTGPNMPQTEIDVIEAYGGEDSGYHSTLHLWPTKTPQQGDIIHEVGRGAYSRVDSKKGYHTYGVLVTPEYVTFYFDRKELARTATPPEFNTPLYMLMDMTILPKLFNAAKGIMSMDVDYVRVWQKNGGYVTKPAK